MRLLSTRSRSVQRVPIASSRRPHSTAVTSLATVTVALPTKEAHGEDGYHAAGTFLLEHIDFLLAVWDGGPSRGPGGTTWMIDQALRQHIPVLVIQIADPGVFRLATRGASVTFLSAEETARRLRAEVASVLNLQPSHPYWREHWPRWTSSFSYTFIRLIGDRTWRLMRIPSHDADCPDVQLRRLVPHYKWLDSLAQHFGEMSRSASLALQMFSALAVAMAIFFGAMEPWRAHNMFAPRLFAILEMCAFLAMLAIDRAAKAGEWHEFWLLYRSLAEQVRCLDFLLPLGLNLPETQHFDTVAAIGNQHNRHAQLGVALQAAIGRAGGLPALDLSPASLRLQQHRVFALVTEQRRYHERAAQRHNRAVDLLVRMSHAAFWAAAVFCAVDVMRAFHLPALRSVGAGTSLALKVAPGLLAGLGALGSGIAARGELRRLAHRSSAMIFQLQRLEHPQALYLQTSGPATSS